jgi:hypothetical protein
MNDEQGKCSAAMQTMQTPTNHTVTPISKGEAATTDNVTAKSRETASASDTEPDCSSNEACVDARVQAHIGRLLRARYQALLDEPMPDRLRACLEQLASKEEGS